MNRNQGAKFILMFAVAGVVPAFAKAPSWFSENVIKKNGKILEVTCTGKGPDKSVASKVGMDQCRGLSLQYVEGYTIKTRSLSIEDNQRAEWHSESSTDVAVSGLNCDPLKQDCKEEDASWTCYLFCRFNLKNARLSQAVQTNDGDSQQSDSLIANHAKASAVPMAQAPSKSDSLLQSQNRQIILSSIPACDSILVIGDSRIIKCEGVQSIVLYPSDKELIVKAKGYKPKHIFLQLDRKPSGYAPVEQIEVFLEKL